MPLKQTRPSVRLEIVCRPCPPDDHDGERTIFGLRRGDGELVPGKSERGGAQRFSVDVEWAPNGKTGRARFYGPFVFPSGSDAQSMSLRWAYATPPNKVISAIKIHLETLEPALLERARARGALETTANAPRWGVDINWHGLGVGLEWRLKTR